MVSDRGGARPNPPHGSVHPVRKSFLPQEVERQNHHRRASQSRCGAHGRHGLRIRCQGQPDQPKQTPSADSGRVLEVRTAARPFLCSADLDGSQGKRAAPARDTREVRGDARELCAGVSRARRKVTSGAFDFVNSGGSEPEYLEAAREQHRVARRAAVQRLIIRLIIAGRHSA